MNVLQSIWNSILRLLGLGPEEDPGDGGGHEGKQRIAVLGGGTGSLAAVYGLTNEEGWQDKYDITVYQMGWRLGGKGASGRNLDDHMRIEEHGIHMWNGFYENAFKIMQDCYAAIDRPEGAPLRTWQEAFVGRNESTFHEEINGESLRWEVTFPTNDLVPGKGNDYGSFWVNIKEGIKHVIEWSEKAIERHAHLDLSVSTRHLKNAKDAARAAHEADDAAESDHPRNLIHALEGQLTHFREHVSEDMEKKSNELRRLRYVLEISVAATRGIVSDHVLTRGYEAINHIDFRAWLMRHGASAEAANCGAIVSLYDALFAYADGDPEKPSVAAGVTLRGAILLFLGYRGSLYYQMQAGMGDVVFGPLYEALKLRGVKFEFFHNVLGLHLSEDETEIGAVSMGRQCRLKDQSAGAEYQPLFDVDGLPCWPDRPLWDQIEDAQKYEGLDFELPGTANVEEFRLEKDKDFDLVLLGIPVGAHAHICKELIEHSEDWREMVARTKTTATQAAQLWFDPEWKALSPIDSTTAAAFSNPLGIVANMTPVLIRETWPKDGKPQACAYVCDVLKTGLDQEKGEVGVPLPVLHPEEQAKATRGVRTRIEKWLNEKGGQIWSGAHGPEGFDYSKLNDPEGREGKARADAQYWRSNVSPSELYVLSVPGSVEYRLKADGSGKRSAGYTNLFLAGDWIDTSLNAGFIESAVIGGLRASRAICGSPKTIVGEHSLLGAIPGRRRAARS